MFIAIDDKTGHIVDAEKIEKSDSTYHCPLCKMKVVLKKGKVKCSHFAHEKGNDCDKDFKTPDMSEWHRTRQSLFFNRCREVVINNKETGEKHRADVLLFNEYVIEFQHSPISAREFDRRNTFYTQCGYKVVWIFDLSSVSDHLTSWYYKNCVEYEWKYPWHIWNNCDLSKGNIIILIELAEHTKEELLKKRCWERIGKCTIESFYEETGYGTIEEIKKGNSFKKFWTYKHELSNRMAFKTKNELDILSSKCPKCGRLIHKYKMKSENRYYYKCYHGKYALKDGY